MNVYLAGPMSKDPGIPENVPTQWRLVVMDIWGRVKRPLEDVQFLCPEFVGRPHDSYSTTVGEDLEMIRRSGLVLACVDSFEREGTFVEMGYAHGLGIPIVGLYASSLEFKGGGADTFSSNLCTDWDCYLHFDDDFGRAACALITIGLARKKLKANAPTLVDDVQLAECFLHDYRDDVREARWAMAP